MFEEHSSEESSLKMFPERGLENKRKFLQKQNGKNV